MGEERPPGWLAKTSQAREKLIYDFAIKLIMESITWLAVAGCGWLWLAVAALNPKNATLLREWCGSEPSDMLRIRTPLEAKCHF